MIRRAKVKDAVEIKKLIDSYSADSKTIPRPLSYIYSNIRAFFICEEKGRIVGCCSLCVVWKDLAEVKSLAVAKGFQGRGIGTKLVKRCLKEARELGVEKVFALTMIPSFFERFGFKRVSMKKLPEKVFGECINCVKYPHCDEKAVLLRI
ncbi:N-acetyltransferase [Candidatus Micrarchaeota archaeon]|nr:N-acetyltransferase [Candidatus Micrarchaeota archaeon]